MSEDNKPNPDAPPRNEPDLVAAGRQEAHAWKQRRAELELATPAPLPEKIGPYRVVRRIGAGGMGVVYEAEQSEPNRRVAVKVVRTPVGTDNYHARLFQREIQVLGRLRHPAIAQIYSAGYTEAGQQYFVMELVDGRPLVEFCELEDLSLRDRLALFAEVCRAVQYAHQRGVIHRDLKPANILVDEDGKPHVLDFGLARVVDSETGDTGSLLAGRALIGTLPYMSPEQTQADPGDLDIRTDVYSLGVILYEMLTGTYPYSVAGQMAEVLRSIAQAEPKRPSTISAQINDEVETIVLKTLSKEPERRYQSAETLAEDVERYLSGEPIEAKRDSTFYVLGKRIRRYQWRIAVSMAFVLAIVALASNEISKAEARELRVANEDLRQEIESVLQDIRDSTPSGAPTIEEAEPDAATPDASTLAELRQEKLTLDQNGMSLARRQGQVTTLAAYITSGNPRGAVQYLDEQLHETPDDAYLIACRGYAQVKQYYHNGDTALLESARGDYQRSVILDPEYAAIAHEGIGYTYHLLARSSGADADYEPAIYEYSAAIAIEPDFLRAYSNRGHAYFDAHDYRLAVADYAAAVSDGPEKLAESVPDAERTYCNYGTALRVLGKSEEAITQYQHALNAASSDVYIYAALALAYLDVGRIADADKCLDVAKKKESKSEWEDKFVRCLALDLPPEELIEAASDSGERCEAYYYAGEALLCQGKQEEANLAFRKCVEECSSDNHTGYNEYRWAEWRLEQAR